MLFASITHSDGLFKHLGHPWEWSQHKVILQERQSYWLHFSSYLCQHQKALWAKVTRFLTTPEATFQVILKWYWRVLNWPLRLGLIYTVSRIIAAIIKYLSLISTPLPLSICFHVQKSKRNAWCWPSAHLARMSPTCRWHISLQLFPAVWLAFSVLPSSSSKQSVCLPFPYHL